MVINSSLYLNYDAPTLISLNELIEYKAWRYTSLQISKKSASLHELSAKKHVVQLRRSDAVCFDFGKFQEAREEMLETESEKQSNSNTQIKPNGLFRKFSLLVADTIGFLNSVSQLMLDETSSSSCVKITYDTFPVHLLVSISKTRDELIYLIVDLSHLNTFCLNTNASDLTQIDFKALENRTYTSINELIECLYLSLSLHDVSNVNILDKMPKLKCSPLIGKYSFTDQKTLETQFALDLNPNLVQKKLSYASEASERTKTKLCYVCFDELAESEFLKLNECEHEACLECWSTFAKSKIESMKVTVSFDKEKRSHANKICCLYDKCNALLRLDTVQSILPLDFANKYVQFYTDLMIIQSNSVVYCANKRCNNLIRVLRGEVVSTCQCGQMICNYCLKENHFPAMCIQAKDYFKNIKTLNDLMVNDSSELVTSEGKRLFFTESLISAAKINIIYYITVK